MTKLKSYLLQLLVLDSYSVDVRELRLLVSQASPLQVTDDLVNYFELSELQHVVADQMRYYGGRSVCISISSGQLVYKKIPHANQWFWDILTDRSCVRIEQIPDGIVPPGLRSVAFDPEVQQAQSERNNRENGRGIYQSRGSFNQFTPSRPFPDRQNQSAGLDRLLSPMELSPNPRGGPLGSSLRQGGFPQTANRSSYPFDPTPQPQSSAPWGSTWPKQQPQGVIDVLGTMSSQKGAPSQPHGYSAGGIIPESAMFGSAQRPSSSGIIPESSMFNSAVKPQPSVGVISEAAMFGSAPRPSSRGVILESALFGSAAKPQPIGGIISEAAMFGSAARPTSSGSGIISEAAMFGSAAKSGLRSRNPLQGSAFGTPNPYEGARPVFHQQSEPLIQPGVGGPAVGYSGQRDQGFPLASNRGRQGGRGLDTGRDVNRSRSNENRLRVVEDLNAAVKGGLIKWENLTFSEETLRYAKENYATLKANLNSAY